MTDKPAAPIPDALRVPDPIRDPLPGSFGSFKPIPAAVVQAIADPPSIPEHDNSEPWFPQTVKVAGEDVPLRNLLIICGMSGAGKTHLGYQLLNDPDYGPDEVYFLMKEDGTSTYGPGARFDVVNTFAEATDKVEVLLEKARAGVRLPKILFMDSLSGYADGTQEFYYNQPIETFSERLNRMVRNKQAEFGELGTQYLHLARRAGNPDLPMTVIANMTTYKDPKKVGHPQLAVEGNMIPKHLSRTATVLLYLQAEAKSIPLPVALKFKSEGSLYAPHRIVGDIDEKGDPESEVMIISRFFHTQDTGEVLAKGHRNLKLKEPANLPDVLRKMNLRHSA